jgi:hypothetical protein
MAYRFTSLPPPACVSTTSGFFEAEICRCRPRYVRPTCATQPTCLPAPALVALVLPSTRGLRPSRDGARDTTFHDVVARFRRTVETGPGCSPGLLRAVELLAPLSRVLVMSRRRSQATVTPGTRRDRRHPSPREGVEREDDPGVPSFGRTLGLPSAGSIRPAPCDADATP